jgi:hypothetical protein
MDDDFAEGISRSADSATAADFPNLERRILDAMDAGRVTMRDAFRLLTMTRERVFGSGDGLSRVSHDGTIIPFSMAQADVMQSHARR